MGKNLDFFPSFNKCLIAERNLCQLVKFRANFALAKILNRRISLISFTILYRIESWLLCIRSASWLLIGHIF